MLETKESKVAMVIMLTFATLLVAGIYPQYVLWMTVALVGIIVALGIYATLTRKRAEPQDERTAKCSMQAGQNGFIVMTVLIALMAATKSLGASFSPIDMAQIVWGFGVTTYLLSYLYYKRVV